MHSSFQNTTYNHALQAQIHGPSGLKVFGGEDLSKFIMIQQVETEKDCSNYSQICGGNNKNKKNKGVKFSRIMKKKYLINRLFKLTNIESNLNKKKISVLEIWKLHINKPIYSNYNKR